MGNKNHNVYNKQIKQIFITVLVLLVINCVLILNNFLSFLDRKQDSDEYRQKTVTILEEYEERINTLEQQLGE